MTKKIIEFIKSYVLESTKFAEEIHNFSTRKTKIAIRERRDLYCIRKSSVFNSRNIKADCWRGSATKKRQDTRDENSNLSLSGARARARLRS